MERFYLELNFVRKAYCSSSDVLVQKRKKKEKEKPINKMNSSNLEF